MQRDRPQGIHRAQKAGTSARWTVRPRPEGRAGIRQTKGNSTGGKGWERGRPWLEDRERDSQACGEERGAVDGTDPCASYGAESVQTESLMDSWGLSFPNVPLSIKMAWLLLAPLLDQDGQRSAHGEGVGPLAAPSEQRPQGQGHVHACVPLPPLHMHSVCLQPSRNCFSSKTNNASLVNWPTF